MRPRRFLMKSPAIISEYRDRASDNCEMFDGFNDSKALKQNDEEDGEECTTGDTDTRYPVGGQLNSLLCHASLSVNGEVHHTLIRNRGPSCRNESCEFGSNWHWMETKLFRGLRLEEPVGTFLEELRWTIRVLKRVSLESRVWESLSIFPLRISPASETRKLDVQGKACRENTYLYVDSRDLRSSNINVQRPKFSWIASAVPFPYFSEQWEIR